MATRMQQRRGTAAQWISTNGGAGPVLNAGEIGWESDTNKFKIGDGVNNWTSLDYFSDINSTVNPAFGTSITFEGATADSFETTILATDPTADRTITLPDVTGTVITTGNLSDITNIGVFTSTITMEGSTANDFELTLSAGDPTADRTITFPDATGTVALTTDIAAGTVTETGTQTLTNKTLTSPIVSGLTLSDSGIVIEGSSADAHETTLTVTNPTVDRTITFPDETGTVQLRVTDVSDTEIGYLNGVTSAIQTQMDAKAPLAAPALTGDATAVNLTISGNLTVNGTTTNINSTNLVVEDKNIVLGDTGTPTDTTADGGGITLKGTSDKTFNWVDATDSWTSSEHLNLASGKAYSINGTALKDVTETLTNKTLTSPTLNNALAVNPILRGPEERLTVSATAATGTIPLDILTSSILYYTTDASANWTLNVRGNGSTSLNDSLVTNDSVTVVFFVTNGATPYYQTGFQIDGSSVTPKWQNGTAPSAGNANSIDIYSFTIVKTGSAAFTAFGSQTKFA
jgi:hypothetical protein